MKVKTKHKRYIESSEGTIRIEFDEYHFSDNCFHIDMRFACRKLNNQNFKSIGCAEFYAYIGSVFVAEDIWYTDSYQWQEDFGLKVWDAENKEFKKEYECTDFEDALNSDIVFTLNEFIFNPEFRGRGMLKTIMDEFKDIYKLGTILVYPFPLDNSISISDYEFHDNWQKVKKSYERAGFLPVDHDKDFYYLEIESKVNIYRQDKDFFKQNLILWNFYNLEHVQEGFEAENSNPREMVHISCNL
jgi:hypothetical protein